MTPCNRTGDENVPGNNIAYIQLGVPGYRVSQLLANGGTITDAYGIVDVISPSGIPFRGIMGSVPDPMMFVAIYCTNLPQSQAFYQSIGFMPYEYPYVRPNQGQGQFEPPQPSQSIYLSSAPHSFGILLLPTPTNKKTNNIKNKQRQSNVVITPNPALESFHMVYNPPFPSTTTMTTAFSSSSTDENNDLMNINNNNNNNEQIITCVMDPSGIAIEFQSLIDFEREERVHNVKE